MVTVVPVFVFTTPKTCWTCKRIVFEVDSLGDCRGCATSPNPLPVEVK